MDYRNSETLAEKYLQKEGFKIIGRNLRWKKSEIDILCQKDNIIYAIEVKYRSNMYFFQITSAQKLRIEDFMNIHFAGQEWEIKCILVTKNTIEVLDL